MELLRQFTQDFKDARSKDKLAMVRACMAVVMGVVAFLMLCLSTPIGIGTGIYCWAVLDLTFKVAPWTGFKTWIISLVGGGLLLAGAKVIV
jgi:hypothetical protein